jgi:hypothetical protein
LLAFDVDHAQVEEDFQPSRGCPQDDLDINSEPEDQRRRELF